VDVRVRHYSHAVARGNNHFKHFHNMTKCSRHEDSKPEHTFSEQNCNLVVKHKKTLKLRHPGNNHAPKMDENETTNARMLKKCNG